MAGPALPNPTHRRRRVLGLVALCAVVALVVGVSIRQNGAALTPEPVCGLEAHAHSDACHTTELVCGQEESEDHAHTDACYETRLTCGQEEHAHSVLCYCDPTADVEDAATVQATLPASLTGQWDEDLATVALSQVGYTESAENITLADDGATLKGYTRYGDWAGDPYSDWNCAFVSFCLEHAGVAEQYVPRPLTDAHAWNADLQRASLYTPALNYLPTPGDVALLDEDGDGKADALAIVVLVDEDNALIDVVEGDHPDGDTDAVVRRSVPLDGTSVKGYLDVTAAQGRYTGPAETSAAETSTASAPAAPIAEAEEDEPAAGPEPATTTSHDLAQYLTSVAIVQNGTTVTPPIELAADDEVGIQLAYTLTSGVLSSSDPAVTYQLPSSVTVPKALSGSVYNGTTEVGTYTIGTDGAVAITFFDDYVTLNQTSEIKGTLTFKSKAEYLGTGDSYEAVLHFTDALSVTVTVRDRVAEDDATLKLVKSVSHVDQTAGTARFTVTVTSENGTPGPVAIDDVMSAGTLYHGLVEGPITITDQAGAAVTPTGADLAAFDGQESFSFTLPQLAAGGSYAITYTARLDDLNFNDSEKHLTNTATATSQATGKPPLVSTDSEKAIFKHTGASVLKKTGGKATAQADGTVTTAWTVTVAPVQDLDAPWKLVDSLQDGQYFTYAQLVELQQTLQDAWGPGFSLEARVCNADGTQSSTYTAFDRLSQTASYWAFRVTFSSPLAAGETLTFSYNATASEGATSAQTYKNTVTMNDRASSEGSVRPSEAQVWKIDSQASGQGDKTEAANVKEQTTHAYEELPTATDGRHYLQWHVRVYIPKDYLASGLTSPSLTLTETLPVGLELYQAQVKPSFVDWSAVPETGLTSKGITVATTGTGQPGDPVVVTMTISETALVRITGSNWDSDDTYKNLRLGIRAVPIAGFDWAALGNNARYDEATDRWTLTFHNTAALTDQDGLLLDDTAQTQTITKSGGVLEKAHLGSGRDFDNNTIDYAVTVNEAAEQLTSDGTPLTLTDTLAFYSQTSSYKDVQLVEVTFWQGGQQVTEVDGFPLTYTYEEKRAAQNGKTKGENVLTFIVPDGVALTIKYSYHVTGKPSGDGGYTEITNAATLTGTGRVQTGVSEKLQIHIQSAIATAAGNGLTVSKEDADASAATLAGAAFELAKYDGGQWVPVTKGADEQGRYVTDANGSLRLTAETCGLENGVLYRLTEVDAPDGYLTDAAPRYFYVADAMMSIGSGGLVVPEGLSANNVRWFTPGGILHVSNARDHVTLRVTKRWVDENGDDTDAPVDSVTCYVVRTATVTEGQELPEGVEAEKTIQEFQLASATNWAWSSTGGSLLKSEVINGVTVTYSYEVEEISGNYQLVSQASQQSGSTLVVTLTNRPSVSVELPSTGGTGAVAMYTVGACLVVGAVVALVIVRRRVDRS